MVRIANAVCVVDAGHDYLNETAEEVFGFWQDQTDWTQIGFIAERDGEILGAVKLMIANEEDVSAVEFDLMIDPEHWGEGAEEALLAVVEEPKRAAAASRRSSRGRCTGPTPAGDA